MPNSMPKTKWDGAEILLGDKKSRDSYGPPAKTHAKSKNETPN